MQWTRFVNHRCTGANAGVRPVHIDEGNAFRPLHVFVATKDIAVRLFRFVLAESLIDTLSLRSLVSRSSSITSPTATLASRSAKVSTSTRRSPTTDAARRKKARSACVRLPLSLASSTACSRLPSLRWRPLVPWNHVPRRRHHSRRRRRRRLSFCLPPPPQLVLSLLVLQNAAFVPSLEA